jgi:hypothetical protein
MSIITVSAQIRSQRAYVLRRSLSEERGHFTMCTRFESLDSLTRISLASALEMCSLDWYSCMCSPPVFRQCFASSVPQRQGQTPEAPDVLVIVVGQPQLITGKSGLLHQKRVPESTTRKRLMTWTCKSLANTSFLFRTRRRMRRNTCNTGHGGGTTYYLHAEIQKSTHLYLFYQERVVLNWTPLGAREEVRYASKEDIFITDSRCLAC